VRILSLAVLFSLLTPIASARQTLVLGVNGGASPATMLDEMAAVIRHVNTSPNIRIEMKSYPSHDALYAGLKKNEVDLAFLGAVKYVQAHFELGAEPLVSEGGLIRSAIVVAPGSKARTVADLRGRRFAFGYQDSTTTHLIPALLLSKSGIKDGDVKATFAGHDPHEIVEAMLKGEYDACALSDYMMGQYGSRVRVVEWSDQFPGPPIVARKGLGTAVQTEVRRMFVSYKASPDARKQHFGTGAIATTDESFNKIRFLCKVLFKKTYQ
jgi:phosphonate transport system substrate-binding protein